jgi:hypothetical protein
MLRLIAGISVLLLGAASQAAEVRVNDTATGDDDYLCWAPVPLEIELSASESGLDEICLRSEALSPNGGAATGL